MKIYIVKQIVWSCWTDNFYE